MDRRSFMVLMGAGAAFFAGGCSVHREKAVPQNPLPEYIEQISFIDSMRLKWMRGVDAVLSSGLDVNEENVKTFPWYIGPNPAISKEEYELAKYTASDLLFPGFGLRKRIGFYLADKNRSPEIGTKMVDLFLREFSEKDPDDFFLYLRAIYDKTPEIAKKEKVNKEAEDMVRWLYERYLRIEGKVSDLDSFLKTLPFYLDGKRYFLSLEDYYPYAFASLFVKAVWKERNGNISAL